jgi:PTS system mannose-specific IIA component
MGAMSLICADEFDVVPSSFFGSRPLQQAERNYRFVACRNALLIVAQFFCLHIGQKMIGIVIITMGNLGREFRAALEDVMGPQQQLEAIRIESDEDADAGRQRILQAIERVDKGDGALLVTDMFGATPANLAISAMSGPKIEVLSGVSLPMLVKVAKVRFDRNDATAQDVAALAQEAGQKYVMIASKFLAGTASSNQKAPAAVPQRPAAFRFHQRQGLIDVAPEEPDLINADIARDLYEQLKEKALSLKSRLRQTNSDARSRNSVDRLLDALGNRLESVRAGILLSRSRSIEADRNAFSSDEARRELFPDAIAMMDDVLLSLQDLMAAYPLIRRIEAERLALAIQRDAQLIEAIQAETRIIKSEAESSDAVTARAAKALKETDPDIAEARDLEARASLVADQLLVVRNFASELLSAVREHGASLGTAVTPGLRSIGSELRDVGAKSWKETKTNLPPGVGITARLIPLALLVALLSQISQPLAGLAALVGSFGPLVKAIKDFRAAKDSGSARRRPRQKTKK